MGCVSPPDRAVFTDAQQYDRALGVYKLYLQVLASGISDSGVDSSLLPSCTFPRDLGGSTNGVPVQTQGKCSSCINAEKVPTISRATTDDGKVTGDLDRHGDGDKDHKPGVVHGCDQETDLQRARTSSTGRVVDQDKYDHLSKRYAELIALYKDNQQKLEEVQQQQGSYESSLGSQGVGTQSSCSSEYLEGDNGCIVRCLENENGVAPDFFVEGNTHVCKSGKIGQCPATIKFFKTMQEGRKVVLDAIKSGQYPFPAQTELPLESLGLEKSSSPHKQVIGKVTRDKLTGELVREGITEGLTEKLFDKISPPWMIKPFVGGKEVPTGARFFRAATNDSESESSVVILAGKKRVRCKRSGRPYLIDEAGLRELSKKPFVSMDFTTGTLFYKKVPLIVGIGTEEQAISVEFRRILARFNQVKRIRTKFCSEDARDSIRRSYTIEEIPSLYPQRYELLQVNSGLPFPIVTFGNVHFKFSWDFSQCINYFNDLMPRSDRLFTAGDFVQSSIDWSKLSRV